LLQRLLFGGSIQTLIEELSHFLFKDSGCIIARAHQMFLALAAMQ
jgi:hypothetical protein